MRQHKFQKQNRISADKRGRPSYPIPEPIVLCNPQFETHPESYSPPRTTLGTYQQPSPIPVFQLQAKKVPGPGPMTSRNDSKKADIVSVLEMSFSEEPFRAGDTATFKSCTDRSSVTSVTSGGRSRFTESKLQRKSVAYEIFNSIKDIQDQLEQKKKLIVKALGFKPVRSTMSEAKWKRPEIKITESLAEKLSGLRDRRR